MTVGRSELYYSTVQSGMHFRREGDRPEVDEECKEKARQVVDAPRLLFGDVMVST